MKVSELDYGEKNDLKYVSWCSIEFRTIIFYLKMWKRAYFCPRLFFVVTACSTCFIRVCCLQFNLVCGWNFLVPFASTMFMAGVLVCAVSSGIFSDKYNARCICTALSITFLFADVN